MAPKQLKSTDFTILPNQSVKVNVTNGNPGMLLIWASWCNHCIRFKPVYQDICAQVEKSFGCVSIEDSDISGELKTALNFAGYPTIKFFDQKGNIIQDYNGPRTKESILKHVCEVFHHCVNNH